MNVPSTLGWKTADSGVPPPGLGLWSKRESIEKSRLVARPGHEVAVPAHWSGVIWLCDQYSTCWDFFSPPHAGEKKHRDIVDGSDFQLIEPTFENASRQRYLPSAASPSAYR
jgi:hypothetical protein